MLRYSERQFEHAEWIGHGRLFAADFVGIYTTGGEAVCRKRSSKQATGFARNRI